ncbi:SA1362 family protein [Jeotgalibacillus sp. R-1-5s-1]|uniref:SA1362 family protein n=1 Tax=Jeotgalibacillus sp. R-1-5s-1 TaxID=2555897 RepID=UPI00106B1DE6|nr:SA1362 family protein [Jeotgalibacillus sp. R-1-5s-1]TFD92260.1 hypothetical protein E2491_15820 [Jeotgalibacillus sp. R-1-5s-1]
MSGRMIFASVVIILGVIGLISTLVTNPESILRMVLTYAAIALVIYVIYRIWMSRRTDRREQQAFKKAAKQSKKRYQTPAPPTRMKTAAKKTQARKTTPAKRASAARIGAPKLTVIEGKKGKKKKRMSL